MLSEHTRKAGRIEARHFSTTNGLCQRFQILPQATVITAFKFADFVAEFAAVRHAAAEPDTGTPVFADTLQPPALFAAYASAKNLSRAACARAARLGSAD